MEIPSERKARNKSWCKKLFDVEDSIVNGNHRFPCSITFLNGFLPHFFLHQNASQAFLPSTKLTEEKKKEKTREGNGEL